MNTQTFAHAQNITPITDDALIAVNGGGIGSIVTTAFTIFGGGNVVNPARIQNRGPGPQIG
jgi:hypothetical protein